MKHVNGVRAGFLMRFQLFLGTVQFVAKSANFQFMHIPDVRQKIMPSVILDPAHGAFLVRVLIRQVFVVSFLEML